MRQRGTTYFEKYQAYERRSKSEEYQTTAANIIHGLVEASHHGADVHGLTGGDYDVTRPRN